jgi:phosphonate metabolism protein PhnN/1,5-bisphosphokinase (PRPP-forming)
VTDAGDVFVGVVGASGVGKDTVISGAREALRHNSNVIFVRRTITRPADAGGEDHIAVSTARFEQLKAEGAFALDWQAHGLSYGIPAAVTQQVNAGRVVVCNISRAVAHSANELFPRFLIVEITAKSETIARRLAQRGRETSEEIADRKRRDVTDWRNGLSVCQVDNDHAPQTAVDKLVEVILNLSGQSARSA